MNFQVCNKACKQCLFSDKRIVSLARKREIIDQVLRNNSYFVCHKSTIAGGSACCRAFYAKHGRDTAIIRLAEAMGALEFVDVEHTEPQT